VAIFNAAKDKPFGCDMPPYENFEQVSACLPVLAAHLGIAELRPISMRIA